MSEHEVQHSRFGGSSCARWLACPGSVALCDTVPNVGSPYAAEGTAAHALAELCLKRDDHPSAYVGTKVADHDVTQGMADAVLVYLEAVTHELAKTKTGELYVEQGFTLDITGAEPGEIFGTNDAMVFHPETGRLAVFDYKHGAGVFVDVTDNAQLKFYAAGALLSNRQWAVKEIELYVVQPRAFDGDGEAVRSWSFDELELIEFIGELERGVAKAKNATGYQTGSHCRWCPAAAVCPAKEAEILAGMQIAVADLTEVTVDDLPEPSALDLERIGKILATGAILSEWLSQVSAFAEGLLTSGTPVPGFKLVEKMARRKWIEDAVTIADGLALDYGLDPDAVMPRKLVTITEAERLLKAVITDAETRKKALDQITLDYTIKESSGTTMVPASDKRPAVDLVANALHGLNPDGMD